tara:strand:+ start:639 stop:944 length:306 start_codon:yes stop_codon:yes gene_type:complete
MKTSRFKEKPFRSQGYLKVVRGEACLSCASPFDVQAHHLRHAERRGMGRKASDIWAVPLCVRCHMDCHTVGREGDWWEKKNVQPIEWAQSSFSRWEEKRKI